MRRATSVVALAAVLLLWMGTEPTRAAVYTNTAGGNWGNQAIWNDGVSGFPDGADDTATITTDNVDTRDAGGTGYDLPALGGPIVINGGMLINRITQTATNAVTVNSGGVMHFYSYYQNYFDAPNWTVTLNDGGICHIGDMRAGMTSTFAIADSAAATIRCNGGTGDNQPKISGLISGPDTATLTVNAINDVRSNSGITFEGDNALLLCDVVLDHVYYKHRHTNALGPAGTTAVVVRNGAVLSVSRSYPDRLLPDIPMTRDIDLYDGTLFGQAHNSAPVSYPTTITLMHAAAAIQVNAYGTYDHGVVDFSGQITESGGEFALHVNVTGTSASLSDAKLTNGANDFTGLHLTGGRLLASASGCLGDGNVHVGAGAELEVETSSCHDSSKDLYLDYDGVADTSGVLDLGPGGTLTTVHAAFCGGLGGWDAPVGYGPLAGGDYVAADLPNHLVGDGTLRVLVPEPATLVLLGLGFLPLVCRRKRR